VSATKIMRVRQIMAIFYQKRRPEKPHNPFSRIGLNPSTEKGWGGGLGSGNWSMECWNKAKYRSLRDGTLSGSVPGALCVYCGWRRWRRRTANTNLYYSMFYSKILKFRKNELQNPCFPRRLPTSNCSFLPLHFQSLRGRLNFPY